MYFKGASTPLSDGVVNDEGSALATTDRSWSHGTAGRMSTSPGRPGSVTGRASSRAVAPSRRRAGHTSATASTSSVSRSDYRLHLVVTASVGGCMLIFNVTLFFCLYCHRRVRRYSSCMFYCHLL